MIWYLPNFISRTPSKAPDTINDVKSGLSVFKIHSARLV